MLNAKYQQALDLIIEQLKQEYPELQAVFLAGSIIRGEAGPTSDLDLWCIADLDYRVRHTWLRNGVLAEIFLNPVQQNLQYFEEDDFIAMHMLKTGQLIYGNPEDPVIIRLQELARVEHEAGPTVLSETARNLQRYLALDEYEDALDVVQDPEQCRLVGMNLLKKALDFHYQHHGRWEAKLKRLLANLAVWQPDLAGEVRAYIMSGELTELKSILDKIYGPVGGMERFEYSSERDYQIPLAETEIVLIRHGWPLQEKDVHPDDWGLDYTAYLDLAQFIDLPEMQGIERIYTSPQKKAVQTASFYLAQLPTCLEVRKVEELAEARRSNKYYENYTEIVEAYLSGLQTEEGWEQLVDVQERVLKAVKTIAKEARKQRRGRIALVGHGLLFTALKQQVCALPPEEILTHWQAIPFGPFARLKVNAFGEISWLGEVQLPTETD